MKIFKACSLGLLLLSLAIGAAVQLSVSRVVDVSNDQTSQNETPVAFNPLNTNNIITGANDWNYNDGCAVNASYDGGRNWTPTLPNGFLPGVTKFTNDPNVPGTGQYDAGGDPGVAFGPEGTAYFVCQGFNFTSPFQIALLVSRSDDGGTTWLDGKNEKLTRVSTWNGNGKSKGSNGQFPDHESIYVDRSPASPYYGSVYVTWVQFDGNTHSPVNIAYSRDGARTFSTPVQVTAGNVRNNQDARVVSAPDGSLYLTFDNGVQGGKGTVMYASKSTDGGQTWGAPVQFASFNNPVCAFPPYCFNISGTPFRAGGSYPAPAFDAARNRLYVVYPDIAGQYAQIYFTSASANDLSHWTTPVAVAPAAGDRFESELSVAPDGRIDLSFYDRSYTKNALVDLTYATSNDGGATWTTRRVTNAGYDPGQWGVPSGSGFRPFVGDYNGIASTPNGALMTWTGVAQPQPFNLEINFASATVK
jgi:hypothetical protein